MIVSHFISDGDETDFLFNADSKYIIGDRVTLLLSHLKWC